MAGDVSIRASGITMDFEGVRALESVDFVVEEDGLVGLIGPNGAGKTTLVNVLSGFLKPTEGTVFLDSTDVTGWAPERLASAGLGRSFQGARVFGMLSVFENVKLGGLATGLRKGPAGELAWDLLERFGLIEVAAQRASTLSHGRERLVGIARSLAMRPKILLLDEPAAGLNEAESAQFVKALSDVHRDFELGMVVIEHDMNVIMSLCRRIQVLDHGRTIAVGTPAEIRRDPEVLTAYLGSRRAETDA